MAPYLGSSWVGKVRGEPEEVSYAIHEVTASPSADFTVLNKMSCIPELVFFTFPKKIFLCQRGDRFPDHKGSCDWSM